MGRNMSWEDDSSLWMFVRCKKCGATKQLCRCSYEELVGKKICLKPEPAYIIAQILDPTPAYEPEIVRGMITRESDFRCGGIGRQRSPSGYNWEEGRAILNQQALACPMNLPPAPGFPIPPLMR